MRIAHIHWGFPPIIGGVETHLTFMLPEQVKMGHKVFLLTGSANGSPEYFDFHGAKIYRSKFFDLNWLFKSGFQEINDEIDIAIEEFLDKTKPDVVHAHNMHYFSRYHTKILEDACIKRKIPMILTAHNVWVDKLFLDLTCNVKWDKIISISYYIERELLAVGVPKEKIATIHHGIDHSLFSPKKTSDKILDEHPILKGKKQIILHPARMGLAKGSDIVIEAFSLVKEKFPDAFLILSGSKNIIDWGLSQNKDIAFLISLIKHLGLQDNIYINCFAIEKMPDLYNIADVIVYPSSFEEPFGLVTLESMAMEKPIVVTESGGLPEIIQNDINGYVVHQRNHKALAERIIQLLSSKELRDKLGRTGRNLVEERYTKKIYAVRVCKVYEEVIKKYSLKKERKTRIKRDTIITSKKEAL